MNSNHLIGNEKKDIFPPLFIVGAPRSGTTLLASLLDRHSNIAIGPETQFFTEFIPWNWADKFPRTHEELVNSALDFKRIADFGLDRQHLLQYFKQYQLTFANLLRAIMEVYAIGRSKLHPGEKTPLHLEHVPAILKEFPQSRIICIIRDGRDVVRSLLEVPWASSPESPRRLQRFCMKWNDRMEETIRLKSMLHQELFMIVKFEELLRDPKSELEKICGFIGEEFEPAQLVTANPSNVIPEWEKKWKNKASEMLDPDRIQPWRKSKDIKQIWIMNSMMGHMLEQLGYTDTSLDGCPPLLRAKLLVQKLLYLKSVRKISSASLKLLKKTGITR